MNIDISNAHCGPRIQFPDHAWLRVVLIPKNCLRLCVRANVGRSPGRARRRSTVRLPWASSEMNREVFAVVVAAARSRTRVRTRGAARFAKGESIARADRVSSMRSPRLSRERRGEDRHASSCTRRLLVRPGQKHTRRGRTIDYRLTVVETSSRPFFFFFS